MKNDGEPPRPSQGKKGLANFTLIAPFVITQKILLMFLPFFGFFCCNAFLLLSA